LLLLGVPLLVVPGSAAVRAANAATPTPLPAPAEAPARVELVLFWGDGCPKCEQERRLLADLQRREPRLVVRAYEVWHDADNRARFRETARRHGVSAQAVPTTFLGDRVWIGYTAETGTSIERAVRDALAGRRGPGGVSGSAGTGTCGVGPAASCPVDEGRPERPALDTALDVPLLGRVDVGDRSLVVSTLLIGALDGINPCSLWVISILLAMVLRTGSRGRVVAVGSTFLLVTAALYALYVAGIYTALAFVAVVGLVRLGVAAIAGAFGVVNIKDYFWYRRGPSLAIPASSKPGIYARIRAIAGGQSLAPALAATVALAVGVSLLETPCTAGFPVLWTSLLAANDVSFVGAAALFVLYMIPFLLDEIAVFVAAVVTMRATRLQEKHGRLLKLVGGVVMLALAIVMLVDYELMNSVVGATAVFAGAIGLAAVIHWAVSRRTVG
jgi:cytochrome c biogenesis protein CcdA/thiol-disulfide isomerase/thioredoxin